MHSATPAAPAARPAPLRHAPGTRLLPAGVLQALGCGVAGSGGALNGMMAS